MKVGGGPIQVVRIPIGGGAPEPIFSIPGWSSSGCARPPSNLCAVAEQSADHKQMVITSLDPLKGRGPELARFGLSSDYATQNMLPIWNISPDGTWLAAALGPEGPIQIRSLHGGPDRVIRVKDLNKMSGLGWTSDGNALIVSNKKPGGGEIYRVNLQGDAKVLWKCKADACSGIPSPDGRHLAINDERVTANMWMMENF